jgi:hypothetical protein
MMVKRGRAQESCGEGKGLWVSYTRQAGHAPGVRGARERRTKGASDGGSESRVYVKGWHTRSSSGSRLESPEQASMGPDSE